MPLGRGAAYLENRVRLNQTAAAMNTRTKELAALDHAHVWHPFTPMRQWRQQQPSIIESGEGFTLIDTEGQRYIDGVSSLWCNVHGHRVPEIDQAIRDQLDKVAHTTLLGLASPPSIELAHEAILREWERLRSWLNDSREDIRQERFVADENGHAEISVTVHILLPFTEEHVLDVGVAYHSDGQTYGARAGEFGKNVHVQLFYDFLPSGN
jgi:hypothetical protein